MSNDKVVCKFSKYAWSLAELDQLSISDLAVMKSHLQNMEERDSLSEFLEFVEIKLRQKILHIHDRARCGKLSEESTERVK